MYLNSLPEGISWSYTTLCNWESPDKIKGVSLSIQISQKTQNKGVTEDAIRQVLGREAEKLLSKNPFEKRTLHLTDAHKAKNALIEFTSQLEPGTTWSYQNGLFGWKSESGIRGHDLYKWIHRNYGSLNEASLHSILGKDAERILKKTPFVKRPKINVDLTTIKSNLEAFLETLPANRTWSSIDLQKHGEIQGTQTNGIAVYIWTLNNIGSLNTDNLQKILGKDAETLLERNPFEAKRTFQIIDQSSAAQYLKRFIDAWPDNKNWSPNDLLQFGEIHDGVYGYSVYSWINRHYKGFNKDSVKAVLGSSGTALLEKKTIQKEKKAKNTGHKRF